MIGLDPSLVDPLVEERHDELAAAVARFVAEELDGAEPAANDAAARASARPLVRRMGEAGLLRWALPASIGGAATGPDFRALCTIREGIAGASPLADSLFALQGLGSMPIVLAGTDEQKERWLPGVAAGTTIAAFAMTEPEAGSDVASLRTRALREDDGSWRLEGEKHLITNAGIADLTCVFAATDLEAGSRGIGCFVVRSDDPGFRFVRPQVVSEPHPLGEIAFEGCRIPGDRLLGGPGDGFRIGMATLDRLRPTVGAAACGMAARALEDAWERTEGRRQFGAPLADLALVQERLARSATDLAAARLLVYRAALEADRGVPRITLEAATAKLFATEAAQRIVDDAVQLHGGIGVLSETRVDRLYRAVRALRIYEGATEVQYLVIARQLRRARASGSPVS